MTEKLKPCPFCGGEADLIFRGGAWGVRCTREHFVHTYGATREGACTQWNTRAPADGGRPMTADDVLRIFKPLPPAEAEALRDFLP